MKLLLPLLAAALLGAAAAAHAQPASLPPALNLNLNVGGNVRGQGAKCDGATDDSAAFAATLASSKVVRLPQGVTCLAKNLVTASDQTLDLNGSTLAAAPGAAWVLKLSGYNSAVFNGQIGDPHHYTLVSDTAQSLVAAGVATVTVANGAKFTAQYPVVVTLANGHFLVTKIASIAGNVLTLLDAVPIGTTIASGAAVQSAAGVLVVDQNNFGWVHNIIIGGGPVGIRVTNSTRTLAHTTQNHFDNIKEWSMSLIGIMLDVDVSQDHFTNIDSGGTYTPFGAVGIYQEGRNPGAIATGGHVFTNVNSLQYQTGWLLNGAELTNYIGCVGDTVTYDAWDVFNGSWGALNFTNLFAGYGTNGVVIQNSPYVFINGLWTNLNSSADLTVDSASTVWLNDPQWGPSRVFAGTGTVNRTNTTSLAGKPGGEVLRVSPVGSPAVRDTTNNGWMIQDNVTGFGPTLTTRGVDANVPAYISSKGTGGVYLQTNGVTSLGVSPSLVYSVTPFQYKNYTYAALPATGPAGQTVFCTNCLKPGETTGNGTGMIVFDDGHSRWVSTAGTVAAQ